MMTLEELQQSIGVRSGRTAENSAGSGRKLSLEEIRRSIGAVSAGESAPCRTLTLQQVREQANSRCITDPDDITDILGHTVRQPVDGLRSAAGEWIGSILKEYQDRIGQRVSYEDITLLDVMVMVDWMSMHIQECRFARTMRRDLLRLADRNPWFTLLMKVSAESMADVLGISSPGVAEACRELKSSYKAVFSNIMTGEVTVGDILKNMNDIITGSWWIGNDITSYKQGIFNCGRLIQSLIHLICSGYVEVDDRVVQKSFPFNYLRNRLWDEASVDENYYVVDELD